MIIYIWTINRSCNSCSVIGELLSISKSKLRPIKDTKNLKNCGPSMIDYFRSSLMISLALFSLNVLNQHYAVNQSFVVPFMSSAWVYVQELNTVIAVFQAIVFITCAYQIFLGALQPGYIAATISSFHFCIAPVLPTLLGIWYCQEHMVSFQSNWADLIHSQELLNYRSIRRCQSNYLHKCVFLYPHAWVKVLMNNPF